MKLEQIDTSNIWGKVEVMQRSAMGGKVAYQRVTGEWLEIKSPCWDWSSTTYAIICEPVGPDELFVCIARNGIITATVENEQQGIRYEHDFGGSVVRYVRA